MSLLNIGADQTASAAPDYIPPRPAEKGNAWAGAVRGFASGVPAAIGEAAATAVEFGTAIYRRGMEDRSIFDVPDSYWQNDFADSLRREAQSYKPDPATASTAEEILFGLSRGVTKIGVGAFMGGPAGVALAGAEEANTQSEEMRAAGVTDRAARRQAAAAQGAGLALAALPLVGQTAKATAALYFAGGPGGFVSQQALTREILSNAGFDKQAAQYDPLDPVGLALSALIPLPFVAAGVRGQRLAAKAQAEQRMLDGPIPSEQTPTASAAQAYSPEVVDAARVAYAVEQRAAANPAPFSFRNADMHEQALSRAEEQIARGEPVNVTDLAPARSFDASMPDGAVVPQSGEQAGAAVVQEAPQVEARQEAPADRPESGASGDAVESRLVKLADAVDQLRQARDPDATAGAAEAPPQRMAPEPPKGKPRDLRAEVIALRKEQSVLNKLLECINA